jgi:hypothetical protein
MSRARPATRGYVVKPLGQSTVAFVPHPENSGHWFRTDVSVMLSACDYCGSKVGWPCRNANGYVGVTHYDRRRGSRRKKVKLDGALAVVFDIERGLSG